MKNDLIDKINNLKIEEEELRMSFREKLERQICCWRKKPLKVKPKIDKEKEKEEDED